MRAFPLLLLLSSGDVFAPPPPKRDEATGEVVVAAGDWDGYGVRIASRNTFPTAAGLASSAAGLACLSKYAYIARYPSVRRVGRAAVTGAPCRVGAPGYYCWPVIGVNPLGCNRCCYGSGVG